MARQFLDWYMNIGIEEYGAKRRRIEVEDAVNYTMNRILESRAQCNSLQTMSTNQSDDISAETNHQLEQTLTVDGSNATLYRFFLLSFYSNFRIKVSADDWSCLVRNKLS